MKKTTPFFISGLELIKISQLPPEQADYIIQYIPREKMIDVSTDSEVFHDCISFLEYERIMAVFNVNIYSLYFDSQI